MKSVAFLLLVSVLIGSGAALAAVAICSLTSATLSPHGAGLLGVAFGATGGNLTGPRRQAGWRLGTALIRGLVAGGTAALVIVLLQR